MFASLMYPMSKTNISVETVIGSPTIIIKLLGKHSITSTKGLVEEGKLFRNGDTSMNYSVCKNDSEDYF